MRVQYDRFGPFFWVHFDTRLYFHFSFLAARCSSDIHFLGLLWQLGLARNQFLLSRRLQIRLQYYRSFLHIEQPNSIWYFSLSLLDCCSNKKEEDKSCWLSKVLFIEKKKRQRWGKKIMPPMRSGHFHYQISQKVGLGLFEKS